MKISLIMPGRDNLKYAKWSYDSIRKNQGKHEVEICFADDNSSDGTWDWCLKMMQRDPLFKAIRNDSGKRLGHTILYDRLVNEVATSDIAMIWHCDMYLTPGALDAIEKHMYDYRWFDREELQQDKLKEFEENNPNAPVKGLGVTSKNPKTIVSLTRIEPPLHPEGPEKVLLDCGTEPEDFDEDRLLEFVKTEMNSRTAPGDIIKTNGIFAPWAFWVKDFKAVHGHDELYAPQSKEDSDIFNKFLLYGVDFIQTWEGFVYHMTSRGSRFNPTLTKVGTNSDEWNAQNVRSTRNFIRKWGTMVRHDQYLMPIVTPKRRFAFIVEGDINAGQLYYLEPYAEKIIINSQRVKDEYINAHQKDTKYDLNERIIVDSNVNLDEYIVFRGDISQFAMSLKYSLQEAIEQYVKSGSIKQGQEAEIGHVRVNFNNLENTIKTLEDVLQAEERR